MLWDEPKIFFLERRYFFSIILSEFLKNRVALHSFMAFLTGDTLVMKKLYPEWGLEVRLPHFAHGTLLWYCTRHGLFAQEV